MMWKTLLLLLAVVAFLQESAAKQPDDAPAEANILNNKAEFTEDKPQDDNEDSAELEEPDNEEADDKEANDVPAREEDFKMAEQGTKKDEEPNLFKRGLIHKRRYYRRYYRRNSRRNRRYRRYRG